MGIGLRIDRLAALGLTAMVLAACGQSSSTATTPSPSPSPTSPPVVVTSQDATRGTFIVAASSKMTLYTFTKDTSDSGKSVCVGGCLVAWPALTVPAGTTRVTAGPGIAGTLGMITRDDGVLQVAYKGLPLYFFNKDKAPGDVTGVYTNWLLAVP